jgi:effector-binding domain-containing protein
MRGQDGSIIQGGSRGAAAISGVSPKGRHAKVRGHAKIHGASNRRRAFRETFMMRPLRATALSLAALVGLATLAAAQPAAAPASPPPASPPAEAAPPAPPPPPPIVPSPGPDRPSDLFGQEVTLTPKTIVFLKGNGTWDKAFDTITDALKSVYAFLDKQGLKPAGSPMTIYTSADDTGFSFQAGVPVAEAPKDPPKGDIGVGQSPGGKALKFTHRGSYDGMDNTYEAITNYLDEKKLEAQDTFIEDYQTDPLTTPDEKLVVDIYVPLK